jgi:hypothetical protein
MAFDNRNDWACIVNKRARDSENNVKHVECVYVALTSRDFDISRQ